jgi:hypothetical protein
VCRATLVYCILVTFLVHLSVVPPTDDSETEPESDDDKTEPETQCSERISPAFPVPVSKEYPKINVSHGEGAYPPGLIVPTSGAAM